MKLNTFPTDQTANIGVRAGRRGDEGGQEEDHGGAGGGVGGGERAELEQRADAQAGAESPRPAENRLVALCFESGVRFLNLSPVNLKFWNFNLNNDYRLIVAS